MKNILVVNVNWLGDAVFSTPVFKALKDNYPHSRVTCLCVPRVKKVLEFCPFIDEIIVCDEKKAHFWPWAKWTLISELKQKAFDVAFMLHRSTSRALMVRMAGVPQRIGYSKSKWLLTKAIDLNDEGIHRRDVYLKVLEAAGLKIKDRSYELRLKPEDKHAVDELLKSKGISKTDKFIVLHAAGNWDLKRWPLECFVSLIEEITHRLKVKVVLSGGGADTAYCQDLNERAGHKATMLTGETSLGESLALYARAQVVVSSDSGPLHLAHSIGASVVGIYGPTRIETTGPQGKGKAQTLFKQIGCNKAPCYHLGCSNNLCMQSISVEDVFQAIQKFLN